MNNQAWAQAIKFFFGRYDGRVRTLSVPLLLMLFSAIFIAKTAEIISSVLVKSLFSTVLQSNYLVDWICLITGLWVIIFFIKKGWQRISFSVRAEGFIWAVAFIYGLFRFIQPGKFSYIRFKEHWLSSLNLLDILLAPFLGLLLYYFIYVIQTAKKSTDATAAVGFYTDTALVLDSSNDALGRISYITDLKAKIMATKTPVHSFAIGVIGKWGSGKSTFLSSMQKLMDKEEDVIQVQFNPWVTRKIDNITAIFFPTSPQNFLNMIIH